NDGGHGPRGVEYVMTFGNGTRGYETEILYSGPGCLGDEESRSKKEFSYSSIASGANHEKVEIAFDLDKNSTWQLVRATFEWNFDASESATVELIAGTTLEKGEYKSLSSEAFSQNSMSRVMKKTSSR
ncbi:MAG: hypothetical protein H7301_12680, partial [Cryobacterium sp.]|nr:hypothetical protein [Oligoflexia bacterium]